MDERSDLYGLGTTLYALLAGRSPFEGGLMEMDHCIHQTEPTKPSCCQASMPHRLEDVVLKLMAKNPADRCESAKALLSDRVRVGKVQGLTA